MRLSAKLSILYAGYSAELLSTEGVYSRDMGRGNSREGGGGCYASLLRRNTDAPWVTCPAKSAGAGTRARAHGRRRALTEAWMRADSRERSRNVHRNTKLRTGPRACSARLSQRGAAPSSIREGAGAARRHGSPPVRTENVPLAVRTGKCSPKPPFRVGNAAPTPPSEWETQPPPPLRVGNAAPTPPQSGKRSPHPPLQSGKRPPPPPLRVGNARVEGDDGERGPHGELPDAVCRPRRR